MDPRLEVRVRVCTVQEGQIRVLKGHRAEGTQHAEEYQGPALCILRRGRGAG